MSERYEVETLSTEHGEDRWTFLDIDDAMMRFYEIVAESYADPSWEVYLHDLVAGETLIAHNHLDKKDGELFVKLNYDPMQA